MSAITARAPMRRHERVSVIPEPSSFTRFKSMITRQRAAGAQPHNQVGPARQNFGLRRSLREA